MDTNEYQQPGEYSVFEEMEQNQQYNYASTGQRFANLIIDLIVVYAVSFGFGIVLALIQQATGSEFLYEFLMNEERTAALKLYE